MPGAPDIAYPHCLSSPTGIAGQLVEHERAMDQRRSAAKERQMNRMTLKTAAACAAVALALAACNRAESPGEVAADVAEAQADRQESVLDARMDQAEVQADTAQAAASVDPDDRGSAIEDRAEARYNTAIAEARGDLEIAVQGCESMSGEAQDACKRTAQSAYDASRNQAQVALDAERRRADQTQQLGN